MNVSKRQNTLLDFIICEYVKTAKPIPSALVCKKSRLRVSPATIRNEMNYLEENGYLEQRHTSGGRVPTDKAYRYYVNQLLSQPHQLEVKPQDKKILPELLSKREPTAERSIKRSPEFFPSNPATLSLRGLPKKRNFSNKDWLVYFGRLNFKKWTACFN